MSTLLLRITSVVFALYCAGHTYGAMYKDPKTGGPLKQAVLGAMQSYKETIQGQARSYWDFYRGFGFFATWSLILLAILCWQLSTLARTQPTIARPFILTLFAISIPLTVLTFTNFFLAPAIFSTVATVLLGAAVFTLP